MAVRLTAPRDRGGFRIHSHGHLRRRAHWLDRVSTAVLVLSLIAIPACLFWLAAPWKWSRLSLAGVVRDTSGGSPSAAGPDASQPRRPPVDSSPAPRDATATRTDESGDESDGAEPDGSFQWGPWRDRKFGQPDAHPYESEAAVDPQTTIDELVFGRLAELEIPAAKLCSDEVFLRRASLDLLGTLPTADEARRFLDDPSPDKRAVLIDELLQRPEFADYMAMKWCDILRVKAEFPINLWPNAAQAYHRWIRTAIHRNLGCDDFARELLTASGSNFRTPQVNFYRAVQSREPKGLAQAVALAFLGERAENWPTQRLEGMSAFFSQVGYKPTGEWKEEIVYFDPRKGKATRDSQPLWAEFPNGVRVQIPAGQDPRQVFAEWLIQDDNPWFARALANRVWYWLLGRGIVDPPDDVRLDNPASNPALLNQLAAKFAAADYDLRHLCRVILNSHAYQLSCIPATDDSRAAENFAYCLSRRLDAEVLIDAICQITGTTETYSSIIPEPFTFLPDNQRAICLPDGSITSTFLEMFGRPSRDTGLESERSSRLTAAQALHLLNSNHLRNKIKQGPGLQQLLAQASTGEARAELLYLAILSRRPTQSERYVADGLCESTAGAQDLAWALINSDEFLFRH
ncbi:MAG: DUF1553 domain-containing protein [Pirellulaceae bacterium]|nr:DUF1553 domain-containing protein [Pirellulaceae bacterium]